MGAYYNENDPKAAAWLRELIKGGHIAAGDVDERSIEDVCGKDLLGYEQHHFFAGIGGWSLALRMVGWPDTRPVWTGSCPCQPFSQAGKGAGIADERHLWPAWHWLIRQRLPPVIFGEQVASKDGRSWFALVHSDLEDVGYRVGGSDLCAAGVGAPHIRQRLYWVADIYGRNTSPQREQRSGEHGQQQQKDGSFVVGLADACGERRQQVGGSTSGDEGANGRTRWDWLATNSDYIVGSSGKDGKLDHANNKGSQGRSLRSIEEFSKQSPWSASETIYCRDYKWRPIEPGTFPLAHGIPSRVGLLRGYGNAIVPQVAAAFIEAYEDARLIT